MKNPFGKSGVQDEKRIAHLERTHIHVPALIPASKSTTAERIRREFQELVDTSQTEAVPEPATLLVFGAGALLLKRRRK
jgi:hypothetical protein